MLNPGKTLLHVPDGVTAVVSLPTKISATSRWNIPTENLFHLSRIVKIYPAVLERKEIM